MILSLNGKNIAQQTISDYLKYFRKIKNLVNECHLHSVIKFYFKDTIENQYLFKLLLAMKINPLWVNPENYQLWLQNQINLCQRPCSVWWQWQVNFTVL